MYYRRRLFSHLKEVERRNKVTEIIVIIVVVFVDGFGLRLEISLLREEKNLIIVI
jgi:hypothetical protein